jgi:hypothetical protein
MARFSPLAMIDNGVAALSAFSAGFLAFAMPEDMFSRLIVASRIPQFLVSAQPPLGLKSRLVVVALVAIVAYAFVWVLLRALDKIAAPAEAEAEQDDEPDYDAPRLRRADAHPDAPSRRPLLAGSELGEPEGEYEIPAEAALPWPADEAEPAFGLPSRMRASPGFLVPQDQMPEAEPIAAPAPAEPIEAVAPIEAPAPIREPEAALHSAPIPAADMLSPPEAFEAEDGAESEDDSDPEVDDDSLSKLMNRFEDGLSRKQQALPADRTNFEPAAIPAPAAVEPAPAERVGHRLRSAITDLNRISAQGN